MKTLIALLLIAPTAHAGCIGPVIMGECKGSTVPYDTHPYTMQTPGAMPVLPAPPGMYWDHRPELLNPTGNMLQQIQRWNTINPFTGRDPHDPQIPGVFDY